MYELNSPSLMTLDEALAGLDEVLTGRDIPDDFRMSPVLLDIPHLSFEGDTRTGQLLINSEYLDPDEVKKIFADLLDMRFPIARMIPVSAYDWDDDKSMAHNNSSAFNYRFKTNKDELSEHARWAIDLNPMQNPFIGRGMICPPEAVYDPTVPGTVTEEVAAVFKHRGWICGADWIEVKDYGHFEKPQ